VATIINAGSASFTGGGVLSTSTQTLQNAGLLSATGTTTVGSMFLVVGTGTNTLSGGSLTAPTFSVTGNLSASAAVSIGVVTTIDGGLAAFSGGGHLSTATLTLQNGGTLSATGTTTVASSFLVNTGDNALTGGSLTTPTVTIVGTLSATATVAAGATTITGGSASFTGGGQLSTGTLTLQSGGLLRATGATTVGTLFLVAVGGNNRLSGGSLTAATFSIPSAGRLTVSGTAVSVTGASTIDGGAASFTALGHLSSGTLTLQNGGTLSATGANTVGSNFLVNPTGNNILSGGSLTAPIMTVVGTLNATNAVVSATSATSITAGTATFTGGHLSTGTLTLQNGTLNADGTTTVASAFVVNLGTNTLGGGNLTAATMTVSATLNATAEVSVSGATSITGGSASFTGSGQLSSGTLTMQSGGVLSGANPTTVATVFLAGAGTNSLQGGGDVDTGSLTVSSGGILTSLDNLVVAQGTTITGSTLSFTGAAQLNTGALTIVAGGTLRTPNPTSVTNQFLLSASNVSLTALLTAGSLTVTTAGVLSSSNRMTVNGIALIDGSTVAMTPAAPGAGLTLSATSLSIQNGGILSAPGTSTVTTASVNVTVGGDTVIDGGTVSLHTTSAQLSTGTLALRNAALAARLDTSGAVTVAGSFNWTGGVLQGGGHMLLLGGGAGQTVTPNLIAAASPGAAVLSNFTIDNGGKVAMTGSAAVVVQGTSAWNNLPGSKVDLQNAAGFNPTAGANFLFTNSAVSTAGPAAIVIESKGTLAHPTNLGPTDNEGQVLVQQGNLLIGQGGITQGGAFAANSGAAVTLVSTGPIGPLYTGTNSAFAGAGSIIFDFHGNGSVFSVGVHTYIVTGNTQLTGGTLGSKVLLSSKISGLNLGNTIKITSGILDYGTTNPYDAGPGASSGLVSRTLVFGIKPPPLFIFLPGFPFPIPNPQATPIAGLDFGQLVVNAPSPAPQVRADFVLQLTAPPSLGDSFQVLQFGSTTTGAGVLLNSVSGAGTSDSGSGPVAFTPPLQQAAVMSGQNLVGLKFVETDATSLLHFPTKFGVVNPLNNNEGPVNLTPPVNPFQLGPAGNGSSAPTGSNSGPGTAIASGAAQLGSSASGAASSAGGSGPGGAAAAGGIDVIAGQSDRSALDRTSVQDASAIAPEASLSTNSLSRSLLTGARSTTNLLRQKGSSVAPVSTLGTQDIQEEDTGTTDTKGDEEFSLPDYLIGPAAVRRRAAPKPRKGVSFQFGPGIPDRERPVLDRAPDEALVAVLDGLGPVWATVPGGAFATAADWGTILRGAPVATAKPHANGAVAALPYRDERSAAAVLPPDAPSDLLREASLVLIGACLSAVFTAGWEQAAEPDTLPSANSRRKHHAK
jgi:hypothetical protein